MKELTGEEIDALYRMGICKGIDLCLSRTKETLELGKSRMNNAIATLVFDKILDYVRREQSELELATKETLDDLEFGRNPIYH